MNPNPYGNRGAIRNADEFFGRARELKEIYDLVLGGGFVSLVGERRVGKSSLLNAIALGYGAQHISWEVPREFRFVLVTCQLFELSSEAEFVRFLLNRIIQSTNMTVVLPPERKSLTQMGELFCTGRDAKRLVVLLDEIDVLVHNDNIPASFFSFLRSWGQQFQVSILIASREGSLEPLIESDGAGSPFWNVLNPVYIGPLEHGDAMRLITEPAERADLPFSAPEIEYVWQLGGHHPFFLQVACYHLFKLKAKGCSSAEARELLAHEFRHEVTPHFAYLLHRLGSAERDALQKGIQTGEIPSALRPALLRKGLVIESPAGVRVFSTTLKEFLNAENQLPRSVFSTVRAHVAKLIE